MTDAQLWYIGGLFDSDGCVSIERAKYRLSVQVSQAEKGRAVLEEIRRVFGGAIRQSTKATDRKQVQFQWRLYSTQALEFCSRIHPFTFLKRQQLLTASQYPITTKVYRVRGTELRSGKVTEYASLDEAVANFASGGLSLHKGHVSSCVNGKLGKTCGHAWEIVPIEGDAKAKKLRVWEALRQLKGTPHSEIGQPITIWYAAGFFDGDGCFAIKARGHHQHVVSQKYIPVCSAFQQKFGGSVYCSKQGQYTWQVFKEGSAFVQTIAPYLKGKLAQAKLIMRFDNLEVELGEVRSGLVALKGNNARGLPTAGSRSHSEHVQSAS